MGLDSRPSYQKISEVLWSITVLSGLGRILRQGEPPCKRKIFTSKSSGGRKGDVFLADRAYAGWFEMARMIGRGAHVVVRKHQMRKSVTFQYFVRFDDIVAGLGASLSQQWSACVETNL